MKKVVLLLVVLVGLPLLFAQEGGMKNCIYTGKVGFFRPSDGDLRSSLGSSWFLLGLDAEYPMAPDASWVASLEYLKKSRSGVKLEEIPLLITWRKTTVEETSSIFETREPEYFPYIGLGAGLYRLKYESPSIPSDTTWKLGFHVALGARFRSNMFSELRWNTISKWHDTNCGGYTLIFGVRF